MTSVSFGDIMPNACASRDLVKVTVRVSRWIGRALSAAVSCMTGLLFHLLSLVSLTSPCAQPAMALGFRTSRKQ